MKTCNCCGKDKPLTEFHGNGHYKGTKKYKPDCRHCSNYKLRMHVNNAVEEHFGSWKLRTQHEQFWLVTRDGNIVQCYGDSPYELLDLVWETFGLL